MPQIQMLEKIPGFGERLGQALGGGIGQGITQRLQQYHQQKQNLQQGSALASAINKPELAETFGKLGPELSQFLVKNIGAENLAENLRKIGGIESTVTPSNITDSSEDNIKNITKTSMGKLSDEQFDEMVRKAPAHQQPALIKARQAERKLTLQEEKPLRERNLKLFDETTEKLKDLEESEVGFEQLSKLSEKISKTEGTNFFERLGKSFRFDPSTGGFTRIGKATSTPEEERYVKLIADQTKNIKNDYGARVTNFDIEVFLRRFPDLMMTSEGRKEILDTLKDYNQAKKIYNQALKTELRQSKGKIDPYELDEIVERKIFKSLGDIKQRMINRGFSTENSPENAQSPTQNKEIRAHNPQTGQTLILKDGKWQLAQ